MNNADRDGKQKTRVEHIILSGTLPVMGEMGAISRNCKTMAINALVEQMCEEGIGFIDLWRYFVGRGRSSVL